MKKISVLILPCVVLSLTLLLAACGGGGSPNTNNDMTAQTMDPPPDDMTPPPDDMTPPDDDDMPPSPPSHSEYDLSMVTSDPQSSNYAPQAHYGITKIGANKLHWSRLTPLDADKPDHHASRYIRGGGVTVGIVDSGVDLDHPDLAGNIVVGDEIMVGETIYPDPTPYAQAGDNSHGTGVAGIIGAILTNTIGVVGVAPEAKLLPINLVNRGGANTVSIAEAYAYVAANKAFVVNNSWGLPGMWLRVRDAQGRKVCVFTRTRCWIFVPVAYDVEILFDEERMPTGKVKLTDQRQTTIEDIRPSDYTALSDAVRDNDLLLVFSNGNHGWNSETGAVKVCLLTNPTGCSDPARQTTLEIKNFNAVSLTLTVTEIFTQGASAGFELESEIEIPFPEENSIGAIKKAPADFNSEFGNNWLNVVAVDAGNKIYKLSNGCGAAKANCLAAPGVTIRTTAIPDPDNPDNIEATDSGTSYAAPHVSGAAALLKGAFPNLSAPQVLEILLQSADGAGEECAAETDKKTPCTDDVYGHGILNVAAAFTPDSFIALTSPARLNAGGVDEGAFSLANSRIELSPAFGAAAWQKESLAIGGLDNYGRVYYTQVDLSAGVFVVKPLWEDGDIAGGGIHASYASPLLRAQQSAAFMAQDSLAGGQWQGQQEGMDYSLRYGARAQQRSIGWQQGSGRLSWNYLSGSDDVAANDFSTDGNSWRLPFSAAAMHQFAGAFDFSDSAAGVPQVGISYGRSEDDGISQLASYAQWGDEDSGSLRLEGGYVQEKDGVLGASFAGGFALSTGETFYQRLSGRRQLFGVEWVADYVHARSKAAGDGGIVQSLKARSDAWMVGANSGHWSLQWSQPLAINAGSMALSYISGYTESGDYAVTDKRLDISSGNRLQRTTLLYMREATDDLTFAFSLDYLRNAPHRDYRKNAFIGAAALRYTF